MVNLYLLDLSLFTYGYHIMYAPNIVEYIKCKAHFDWCGKDIRTTNGNQGSVPGLDSKLYSTEILDALITSMHMLATITEHF